MNRSGAPIRDESRCANCAAPLTGPFCSACGQASRSPITSMRAFLAHAFEEIANLDSRLIRSIRALIFRPGTLTADYLAGRRARYTQPVSLYLLAAALFFFTASLRPFLWIDTDRRQIVGALPGLTVGNDLGSETLSEMSAQGVSLELLAERFVDAVNAWLPAFLVGSVVLFALVLFMLYRRVERRFLAHVVFALHWTAFYLSVIAVARLFPVEWRLQNVSMLFAIVWLTFALRRSYGQRLWTGVLKAFVLMITFLVILVLWVQSAIGIGMLSL